MDHHPLVTALKGIGLLVGTFLSSAWLNTFPVLQGVTVVCGCVLAVHGVYRLVRTRGWKVTSTSSERAHVHIEQFD